MKQRNMGRKGGAENLVSRLRRTQGSKGEVRVMVGITDHHLGYFFVSLLARFVLTANLRMQRVRVMVIHEQPMRGVDASA
jgi:hypothetical protein